MTWRPEYGWWRVTWRTTLAVAAAALLTVSAIHAPEGTSSVSGDSQAATTAPAPQPSSGEPDPDREPSGDQDPSDNPPAPTPSDQDPPESPGTPGSVTTGSPEPDRSAAPGDDCESDTDCVQTEEDVDTCDTGDAACESDGEEAKTTDRTGDQDTPL
jgi:hypothetical protein